jgi:adenosylcobinamide kinase/adenosylcobinamide-phosphate guanylyltransferase
MSLAKKCALILGGARSGKSRFAQELARKWGDKVVFVATAEAGDAEMKERIKRHREARPKGWRTLEIATELDKHLASNISDGEVVIIDCLSLFISNLLGEKPDYKKAEADILAEIDKLTRRMDELDASFIIVSNEVGMGLVPENRLGRLYRDIAGRANELIADYADEVYLMVAGIPLKVKGS